MHLEADDLREQLRARVIGQDHAVDALVRAVTIGRSRLLEPDRPLAGLLFVGPTGVGKTQLVRALAELVRSHPEDFCRIDMSALAQEHFAASLAVMRLVLPSAILTLLSWPAEELSKSGKNGCKFSELFAL